MLSAKWQPFCPGEDELNHASCGDESSFQMDFCINIVIYIYILRA